jgi:DNA polymerase-3 subunit alpha
MSFLEFECGCKIPVVDGVPQIDYYALDLNCPLAWKIYQDGYTQSIFQLESYLGKNWSKKLKPESIEDAAALISIIRPGTLQSQDSNGVSLTKVFCDRKNSNWQPTSSVIDQLLKSTYGVNIYQETSMRIAKELAGFDGPQQMRLIKGIGKKKADVIFGLRKEFITGCKTVGKITEEEANSVFDNIENSARYAFNLSHAVGYAVTGYWTAWVKAHLPKHYICSWLRNAKNEQKPLEEIRAVVSEARRLGIAVLPPSLKNLPTTNFFIKRNCVHFGLDSIKGCGEKGVSKLTAMTDVNFEDCSWLDFLVLLSPLVNKTQVINMIRSGCFDYSDIDRSQCEYEYTQFILLSKKEVETAKAFYQKELPLSINQIVRHLIEGATAKRKLVLQSILNSLLSPAYSLKDSRENIIAHEKELMGINISCSAMDKASIPEAKNQCAEVEHMNTNSLAILVGEITECREIKIKNGKMAGQDMATLQLVDESGSCDCVIFPKELSFYEGGVYDGNVIMVRGKKNNRGGIIIEKVYEV